MTSIPFEKVGGRNNAGETYVSPDRLAAKSLYISGNISIKGVFNDRIKYGSEVIIDYSINVKTIDDLRQYSDKNAQCINVLGYYSPNDGGGGVFQSRESAAADNGGTIIVSTNDTRWYRVVDGRTITPRWFGARANGTTDDAAPINACLAWIINDLSNSDNSQYRGLVRNVANGSKTIINLSGGQFAIGSPIATTYTRGCSNIDFEGGAIKALPGFSSFQGTGFNNATTVCGPGIFTLVGQSAKNPFTDTGFSQQPNHEIFFMSFRKIFIDCNWAADTAIHAISTYHTFVQDCVIVRWRYAAIRIGIIPGFGGAGGHCIEGNRMYQRAADEIAPAGTIIVSGTVSQPIGYGVIIDSNNDSHLLNNTIIYVSTGIYLKGGGYIVEGNHPWGNRCGMELDNCDSSTIVNNYFDETGIVLNNGSDVLTINANLYMPGMKNAALMINGTGSLPTLSFRDNVIKSAIGVSGTVNSTFNFTGTNLPGSVVNVSWSADMVFDQQHAYGLSFWETGNAGVGYFTSINLINRTATMMIQRTFNSTSFTAFSTMKFLGGNVVYNPTLTKNIAFKVKNVRTTFGGYPLQADQGEIGQHIYNNEVFLRNIVPAGNSDTNEVNVVLDGTNLMLSSATIVSGVTTTYPMMTIKRNNLASAIAIGTYAETTSLNGVAIGTSASATGLHSYVFGNNATASGTNCMSIGTNITNANDNSIMIASKFQRLIVQGPICYNSDKPSIAAGGAAGTTPTIAILNNGTDMSGTIDLTTGTSPATNAILAVITFNLSRPTGMYANAVLIYPGNVAAAAITGAGFLYTDTYTVNGWTLRTTTALTASTQYLFRYVVV